MSDGMAGGARRLAVVDDDAMTRRALKPLLEEEGWQVDVFASAEDALPALAREGFTALVTDNVLPGIHGLELARRVRATHASMRCVVISGYDQPSDVEVPWLRKPIDFDALLSTLDAPR
ncbi:MAG: response regulator [Polyangiales bacterium]